MSKEQMLREFMTKVWNEQRKELVEKYVHNNYHIHIDAGDNWEGQTFGHEEFKKRLDFSFDSFPDMHFQVNSAIEEENHVAITWTMTGTNKGEIGGYPATHKQIKTDGITIYHFTENLISGHSQVFDRVVVMKQLGFM